MIVNESRYGGSGGWIATSTTHADGPEICIHELGHSFAGLSDEYWAGPQYARENINMTAITDTGRVKWNRWLSYEQTGIYPHTESPSWYRPHQNCEMRFLNRQFCPVCTEATVGRILDLVSPLTGFTPAEEGFEFTVDTIFRLDLLKPEPNTLMTNWILNGDTVSHNSDTYRLNQSSLNPGINQLSCFIIDTTAMMRDSSHTQVHLSKVNWTINNISSGIGHQPVEERITFSAWPNPASDQIHLNIKANSHPDSEWTVRLLDNSGRVIGKPAKIRADFGSINHTFSLRKLNIPGGQYFISVQAKDFSYRIPIILVR